MLFTNKSKNILLNFVLKNINSKNFINITRNKFISVLPKKYRMCNNKLLKEVDKDTLDVNLSFIIAINDGETVIANITITKPKASFEQIKK